MSSDAEAVMTVEASIQVRSPAYALCARSGHLPSNHMTKSKVAKISWTTKGADHVAVRQARGSSVGTRVKVGIVGGFPVDR